MTAERSAAVGNASPTSAEAWVRPVDLRWLHERLGSLSDRSRELVRLYMEAARRVVLAETDGCFPHDGDMLYRNYAERAKGAAILSAFAGFWPEELRIRCRREAARLVGEVAAAHRRQRSFGNEWQGPLFVAEAGMAAWFLWDELEPVVRRDVADMVVFQAERLEAIKPKMGFRGDTQAETVAWNSAALAVAVNMMPGHPHAARWERAVKTYLYNTFAAPQDAHDESLGDDGMPVNEWILGANIHEDFALENHNQFHVDYLLACYRFHVLGAAMYQTARRPLPHAIHHHARDVYQQVMLRCTNHDGFFQYVSDNDWRRYHAWTESATVHAYLAFLEHDSMAAALESRALANALRYWRQMPPDWAYDNPYVCGKPWTPRIAEAVLLHITAADVPPPSLSDDRLDAKLTGTCELRSVRLLTHYSTSGSFRSFYGGPGRSSVRFVAPADSPWPLLPLGANYRVGSAGKPLFEGGEVSSRRGADWFWTVQATPRGGEVFVSLPDEIVLCGALLAEPASASAAGSGPTRGATRHEPGPSPTHASTSVADQPTIGDSPQLPKVVERTIALEKPHGPVCVYFRDGRAAWEPGKTDWLRTDDVASREMRGDWVDLCDGMGYVFLRNVPDADLAWFLPNPTKREALKLRVRIPRAGRYADCLLALPGHSHERTAQVSAGFQLTLNGNVMAVTAGDWQVWVNFGRAAAVVRPPDAANAPRTLDLPPLSVCGMRAGHAVF